MKKKYCIFDLDGTLLDTLDDLANSVNMALAENGLPQRTREEIRSFVGNGIRVTISRSVPDGFDSEQVERIHQCFCHIYETERTRHTGPYPGLIKVLEKLKDAGVEMAVLSNKADDSVKALCDSHFPGVFQYCQGLTDDMRPKPYPDSLQALCKKMGTIPQDVIYIGDSEVDVETAKAAGASLVAVTWGFRSKSHLVEKGAKVLVDSTQELEELLLS